MSQSLRDVAPHLAESLDRYATERVETGGFLRACLENNFLEACGRADHVNRTRLHLVAEYIYNELPANCHGSRERVNAWLAAGRDRRAASPAAGVTSSGIGKAPSARITVDPAQMGGVPCLRGLRIPVSTIAALLTKGKSHEEILADYPDLEAEDIRAVVEHERQGRASTGKWGGS